MPDSNYLPKDTGGKLVKVIVFSMLIQLAVITYVYVDSTTGRTTVRNTAKTLAHELLLSQRSACERGKLDRQDNAEFQTAQSNYIFKVTQAASVKEDVKRAAREARKVFTRTSNSLLKRSLIDCNLVFPDPKEG